MKTICIVLGFLMNGDLVSEAEKPMRDAQECRAWKHQQEFMYSPDPSMTYAYVCLTFWEA